MKWSSFKFVFVFIFMLMSQSSKAYEYHEQWSNDNRLYLQLSCTENESLCLEFCQKKNQCTFFAGDCKDCIGTNMQMNQIFDQMGIAFRNSGESVDLEELKHFLAHKSFVSITSKSIYNQIDSYDSPALKWRFQNLCPNNVDYPIVLFELNPQFKTIKNISMVICGEDVYRMTDSPEVRKIDTELVWIF